MDTAAAQQAWNERYATKEYVWNTEPNQFVRTHLSDLEPGTAIDLGAGEGRNAVWLATRGWTVTAVDFSSVGLEKAARLAGDEGVEVAFVVADATTYEASGPADLVIVSYLQLEEKQRRTVLEHAKRWLAPGGTIFVIAHDRSNVEGGYGGPSSPAVCYTVDEAVEALDGLDIGTAMVAERVVDTDDGSQTALDTLVIATRPA